VTRDAVAEFETNFPAAAAAAPLSESVSIGVIIFAAAVVATVAIYRTHDAV
jgi:hypothetical protein